MIRELKEENEKLKAMLTGSGYSMDGQAGASKMMSKCRRREKERGLILETLLFIEINWINVRDLECT